LPQEDLEDLAAEKSLDLMRRIVSGVTEFHNRSQAEIMSFFSRVARNALLDLCKERGRRVEARHEGQSEQDSTPAVPEASPGSPDAPDLGIERREYVSALRKCVKRLDPRSRLIWFCRVFYEMASKEIAVHPQVSLQASHVDVILMRTRREIRGCMHRRGFQPRDMPLGTFSQLWQVFHPAAVPETVEQTNEPTAPS
jgi:RNA polymerase sigma factor (sigma-70 family)